MRDRWSSIVAVLTLAGAAFAQPTALTYQGRLKNGGQPASGLHDFRFRLFDAAQGGNQLGDTQCLNNISVADGLFTATIDFGQQFISPHQRFLEIQVREDTGKGCGDGAGFVALNPRQPVTAAPLANHAKSAFALDAADGGPENAVFVDNQGWVGIGTVAPTAPLEVSGGPMVVQNFGDQADALWLGIERSWVFRQEGTGAGTALKLQSIGGGGNKNFIVKTDGLVGIGTTLPLAKLDVRGDIRLGSNGQLSAAAGAESLRIIRGTVAADGTIVSGSGFTVNRFAPGQYMINFSSPFSSPPSMSAMAEAQNGAGNFLYRTHETNRVEIWSFDDDVGDGLDSCNFSFTAIGPR